MKVPRWRLTALVIELLSGCAEEYIRHDTSGRSNPENPTSSGPGNDEGEEDPSSRCPLGQTFQAGFCVIVGDETCESTNDCDPGWVCRSQFDVSDCVCDPRPGAAEGCAARCTSDADCDYERPVGYNLVCDTDRGFCRYPSPCLSDSECTAPEHCVDREWYHWYVDGVGELNESSTDNHCAPPGTKPLGAYCQYSGECMSGACAGDDGTADALTCGVPCLRNSDCNGGEYCVQPGWGPPVCKPGTGDCTIFGASENMCRLGEWVLGCRGSEDCNDGDCRFSNTTKGADHHATLGFGVGQCQTEQRCREGEFRSEWVDTWVGTTCFTHRECWDDTDCDEGTTCLGTDAIDWVRRCGYEVVE